MVVIWLCTKKFEVTLQMQTMKKTVKVKKRNFAFYYLFVDFFSKFLTMLFNKKITWQEF